MAGLFVRIRRQKFTYRAYICYRRLIRHEWIYYGTKNCVIYNNYSLHTCSIFVCFPWRRPCESITQYVAWMERQLNACQTPRSMHLSIFNSFRVIRCLSQCVSPKIAFYHIFVSLGDVPGAITLNVVWMEREFHAYKLFRSIYPSIFNSFPVIRTANAKKSPFSRTAEHIFVSPRDAPATITQYVAWMERQFNACQTPRSIPIYLQ